MSKTKVAIIGLGGVGGYFGFKLALHYLNSKTVDISFVARGGTFAKVYKDGLTLISPENTGNCKATPANLYDDVNSIANSDYLLVSTKEYDLEKICISLKDTLSPSTVIIPLMNGVDIYERIRRVIKKNSILPTCLYVASHQKLQGVIVHKGNPGKIIIGNDPSATTPFPYPFLHIVKNAGIDIQYKESALSAIWTKFMFIAPFGLITAKYNLPIGEVLNNPILYKSANAIMNEIETIARKLDVALPPDIKELTFEKATTFPHDTPTSLQLDINSGKQQSELALFAGAIIKKGLYTNTQTPETIKLYNEILSITSPIHPKKEKI